MSELRLSDAIFGPDDDTDSDGSFLDEFEAGFESADSLDWLRIEAVGPLPTADATESATAGDAEGDCCCICLQSLQPGRTAVVCSRVHVVCHGCFATLHSTSRRCPSCRDPLLEFTAAHAYAETLPAFYQRKVKAAQDAMSASLAQRLDALERESAASPPPPPPLVGRRGRKRRSTQAVSAAIEALPSAAQREYERALRAYRNERERLRARVQRRRHFCERSRKDPVADAECVELQARFDAFVRANPKPVAPRYVSQEFEI